jgi:UDP-glucose 4-epimerase
LKILITGGAGYLGSHTAVELVARGHEVVLLDNFVNASRSVLGHLEGVIGHRPRMIDMDVRSDTLAALLGREAVDIVVHFAALKSLTESNVKPLDYYDNNVGGMLNLLQAMRTSGVNSIVFSSSATVYGRPDHCPIDESAALRVTNPYGRTKLFGEEILRDAKAATPAMRVALLRYFNPVGAHESGLLGEHPQGLPNNLMPYISQVAVGQRPYLNVYGTDYDTVDGTGVRDYIHVVDLAKAHVLAVEYLASPRADDVLTVNLGTGKGYSVLEVVAAFEQASGRKVPVKFCARRPGDVATCYADPALAAHALGWKSELDLGRMCADTWRWQSMFPGGYPN